MSKAVIDRLVVWRLARTFFSALLFWPLVSCNIFEGFADKTSEDAILIEAKKLLDAKKYTEAIAKFEELGATTLNGRDVKILYASAYAGRCGLDFLDLANKLKSASSGRVFELLFDVFPSSTVAQVTDCRQAEDLVNEIGSEASKRTSAENIFMAFLSFAKVGAILNHYGDQDENKNVDAAFNPCSDSELPEDQVAEIGTGLANAYLSLTRVSSEVAETQLSALTSLCSDLATVPPTGTYNAICTTTNAATVEGNATLIRGIRSLVNESQAVGLGTCTGDVVTCLCP